MIEQLACRLGRNDEVPNIELARLLCESENENGIREIAEGLRSSDTAVANDCIKVLYEIGESKPELIAGYTEDFINALSSSNNRIVWGSMKALSRVAPLRPEAVFKRLPEVITAYTKGSVITRDNSISVFAALCAAQESYRHTIFPLLLEHIAGCRAKEIPQHAERIVVCLESGTRQAFVAALEKRKHEMTETQNKRIDKLIQQVAGGNV